MLRVKMKSDKTETHFLLWLKGTLVWLNWERKLLAKENLKCDFSLWFSHKYHFLLYFTWQKCMIFAWPLNVFQFLQKINAKLQSCSCTIGSGTQTLGGGGLLMHSCASETSIYFPYSWVDEVNGVELAMMRLWGVPPPRWDTSTSLHFSVLVN